MSLFSTLFGRANPAVIDKTLDILQRHLNNDFRAMPMAESATSSETVQALADKLGVPLPAEVLAHLSGRFPGVYLEAKEEVWPRAEEFAVGPFWSFLYGLHTFTASADSEDWMRAEVIAQQLFDITGEMTFPVLKVVGDADIYCVNSASTLVRFNSELNEFEPIELSFFELLEQEVQALVARTEKMKQGE